MDDQFREVAIVREVIERRLHVYDSERAAIADWPELEQNEPERRPIPYGKSQIEVEVTVRQVENVTPVRKIEMTSCHVPVDQIKQVATHEAGHLVALCVYAKELGCRFSCRPFAASVPILAHGKVACGICSFRLDASFKVGFTDEDVQAQANTFKVEAVQAWAGQIAESVMGFDAADLNSEDQGIIDNAYRSFSNSEPGITKTVFDDETKATAKRILKQCDGLLQTTADQLAEESLVVCEDVAMKDI